MKLKSVRIQNFRCVEDSGEFTLSDVTCLVGKNESGKTALLRSLHKLNPDNPSDAAFVPLEDYPRRRYSAYKDRHASSPDPVLSTVWELDPTEKSRLSEKLGESSLRSTTITIAKGYDNKLRVSGEVDEVALVNHLVAVAKMEGEDAARVAGSTSLSALVTSLTGPPGLTPGQARLLSLVQQLSPDGELTTALSTLVSPLLPKFLYFADYDKMSGQVSLDDFLAKRQNRQLTGGQRIFSALLDLAGITPEELKNVARFEALIAELEAVSNRLTEEIFGYWTQNLSLSVKFDFRQALPGDPAPFNAGWIFRTRVYNELHDVSVSFDDRSTGFIWFFSFLVWFSQLKKTYGENLVVLLDEPGLSLHGKAQGDLLNFLNAKLRPSYQVAYTTHSPFMVDPENLLGVRTVEDESTPDDPIGTKVSGEILSSDADTIFPLQAALGYDIAQSLFVGKHTLLVEGPSDLLYFRWASNELVQKKRTGLDPRWVIAPTGGIDKIWSFVALFGGNKLHVCVVADFHQGDKSKLRSLRESQIIKSDHVLTAEKYAGQPEADIEDILGREFYIALVNKTYGLAGVTAIPTVRTPSSERRVLEEIATHFNELRKTTDGCPVFDHFLPSAYLLEHAADARSLPDYQRALDRVERLFKDLNSLLPVRAT